ncbi:MAG TPA: hypothetical protein VEP66_21120 [Myxococcales bacterium]|nr:hypothetical protein [Myxococcales bacterium]
MAVQGRAKPKTGSGQFQGQGAAMTARARPGLAMVLKTPAESRACDGDSDVRDRDEILHYDGRSGRLSPNARPGGTAVAGSVTSSGPAPVLAIQVETEKSASGLQLVISAALADRRGVPVRPSSVVAVVAANGELPAPEMPMQPVNGADQVFELRVRAPAHPVTFGWAVRARGEIDGQRFDRVAAGAFRAQRAGGRIDATAARVEQRNGDLELVVAAEIDAPGTWWVYAELWGGPAGTRPIAFGRRRFENVSAGPRTLSVSFSGAIIRHSAIDGPYVVRNLKMQQGEGAASEEDEPIPALPPTAPWRAAEFEADSFQREFRVAPAAPSRAAALSRRA